MKTDRRKNKGQTSSAWPCHHQKSQATERSFPVQFNPTLSKQFHSAQPSPGAVGPGGANDPTNPPRALSGELPGFKGTVSKQFLGGN